MLRRLFDTKPDERSATFAEAQGLLDDGLELDFVLGIFPDDADWLAEELEFSTALSEAYSSETPSYYFEASLKSKFLAAAREPARQPSLPVAGSPYRAAVASMGIAAATLGLGVLTFGFVTAGNAVPGDWNYSFKLAHERLQYTLSTGDDRVNIQLRQTETRVEEIQQALKQGDGHVSASDIERLHSEAQALADIARSQPLDDVQKSRVQGVAATGASVLNDVKAKQPDLEAPVSAAAAALGDAAVTALATPTPSPTPTETVTPSATPSASPSPTATGTPTGTAEPTTTATPTGVSGQSGPSATPTAAETSTATPSPTPAP